MKVKVEVECTPEEARTFMGLPDVGPVNDRLVEEMRRRLDANLNMLQPDELLKSWMTFGGQAQEQFRKLLTAAAAASLTGAGRSKTNNTES